MTRIAIMDLGTNSIKFFVSEVDKGKVYTLLDTNNISRLGEGLQKTGFISSEAVERNIEVVKEFQSEAGKYGVDTLKAVGTMCLRTAKNAADFVNRVKSETGIEIEVIDGAREAQLSYLAVVNDVLESDEEIAVFDTGGGSTEFIFGEGQKIIERFSTNIGAVRLTEEFLTSDPVSGDNLNKMLDYIRIFFDENRVERKVKRLVGIGGTLTSLGAVKHKMKEYDPAIIQGSKLSLNEIEELIELFSSKTLEERKKIVGLQPKRADVIIAGASIVKSVMSALSVRELTISDRGLRHGLLFDMIK